MPRRSYQLVSPLLVPPLFACLAALTIHAQDASQSRSSSAPATSIPTIRTNAQAVTVDVVVTHSNDEAVPALHQQDFQVFEDGKPQAIDSFEEHNASADASAITPVQLPSHVYSNKPSSPRSAAANVLLLDSLNTAGPEQANVHRELVDFIGDIQPVTPIAIYTLNTRLGLLQGFTADRSVLRAALNSKAAATATTPVSRTRNDDLRDKEDLSIVGEMSYNPGAADSELPLPSVKRSIEDQARTGTALRASLTLAALEQLARTLAALPGRKNLIWFAGSFPVSLLADGVGRQALPNGRDVADAVRQTALLLAQSNVAVYPVSAQGIQVDHTTNADSGGQPEGDDFERNPSQQAPANAANSAVMEQLAADTGGEAFYTSKNLAEVIADAIQNGSHYYTIVYTPPSAQIDGKFHRIEVRLTESKARLTETKIHLSYRRGYYAISAAATAPPTDPLPSLLIRGLPASTQILFQARALPMSPQPAADAPRAGGNVKLAGSLTRYKVDIAIDPTTVTFDLAPDGKRKGKIEVALVDYDQAGHSINWTGQTLALELNPDSYARLQQIGIPVHLQIDLPRVEQFLVAGVYDWTGSKAGTLEVALSPQHDTAASSIQSTAAEK